MIFFSLSFFFSFLFLFVLSRHFVFGFIFRMRFVSHISYLSGRCFVFFYFSPAIFFSPFPPLSPLLFLLYFRFVFFLDWLFVLCRLLLFLFPFPLNVVLSPFILFLSALSFITSRVLVRFQLASLSMKANCLTFSSTVLRERARQRRFKPSRGGSTAKSERLSLAIRYLPPVVNVYRQVSLDGSGAQRE